MSTEPEYSANPDYGPYVLAALICEKVLQEKDGALSAIRIIDRVTRTFFGPEPPSKMEPFPYSFMMLFILKPGQSPGSHTLSVQPIKPSNERLPLTKMTLILEPPEDRGANYVMNVNLNIDEQGMWRFEAKLDDRLVGLIPFNVMYLPQQTALPH